MKIPIKKFVDDDTKSFQERLYRLLEHHEEETAWMIERIKRLEETLKNVAGVLSSIEPQVWS